MKNYTASKELILYLFFTIHSKSLAGFPCGHRPAMAAVHLFSILPLIKPTNQMASRLFGFPNWF